VNQKELKFQLADLKQVINKWLYIENDSVIDVIAATYIANRFEADPIWMIIIGPPSNSKTELLRAFDGHKNAYFISNLTPSTLVSGIMAKKGKAEPSLLPKLNDKVVILKDFTTILSMRSENQQEILAQLREAYDGQYSKMFGNGKIINWKGRFGLMAACTPVYDSHYGVIGSMGERFLLYRTENKDGLKMGLQAQKIVGREIEMRTEIKDAVHRFINQFDKINVVHLQNHKDVKDMILFLALFVSYGRCPVERDFRDRCVKYQPMPEGTARIVKQFEQIGIGLALAYGKNTIDREVYDTIKKIGRDLIPAQRLILIEHLWIARAWEHLLEWRKTKEIADDVNMPATTVKMILEDLMVVGILNRMVDDEDGRTPYKWQLNNQICEWIGKAEVFDGFESQISNTEYT
jgi:hypothetical protein